MKQSDLQEGQIFKSLSGKIKCMIGLSNFDCHWVELDIDNCDVVCINKKKSINGSNPYPVMRFVSGSLNISPLYEPIPPSIKIDPLDFLIPWSDFKTLLK